MTVILELEADSAGPVVRQKQYDGAALGLGHPEKNSNGHSEGLTCRRHRPHHQHHRPHPRHRYWVANLLVPKFR